MPRSQRICIPGLPHHAIQRGNNRQKTFRTTNDYFTYLKYAGDAANEYGCAIHAYVLMTNHIHLLLTPDKQDSLSRTMHSLGGRYGRYFNFAYERTGSLWEGRFKASVVDNTNYCLCCYRYIELNPVRAGLANDPARYRWSSYRGNAMGSSDRLLNPHPEYLQLGSSPTDRQANYVKLVRSGLTDDELKRLQHGSRNGSPVGGEGFIQDVERHLQRANG